MDEKSVSADGALARLSELFAAGQGGSAIKLLGELLRGGDGSLRLKLVAAVAPTLATAEARLRCYADLRRARGFDRTAVLVAADSLAQVGLYELALNILELAYQPEDASVAAERAGWAMKLGDYARTVAEADRAIATMLRARISVDDFMLRASRGEPPHALLVFERADVARLPRLRGPLVLRWEALRRLGRRDQADRVREVCIRYWPERISVWEAAGQHALDDEDYAAAERYFDRALALDAESIVALAGRAIVLETRKQWDAALELRRRVADFSGAFQGHDAASLHRVIRYASNLGRLGRWADAAPHFRNVARAGTFAQLPVERPVLLRVFTRELYAPLVIARMLAEGPKLESLPDTVQFALRDAELLGKLAHALEADPVAPTHARTLAIGSCAWLGGDVEAAQGYFAQARALAPNDAASVYLDLAAAGAGVDAARAALESLEQAPAAGEAAFYRALIARRAGRELGSLADEDGAPWSALLHASAHEPSAAASDDDTLAAAFERLPQHRPSSPADCVRYWTALRETFASAGYPVGVPARLSALSRWDEA